MMTVNYDRLKVANEVIPFLLPSAKLEVDRGKIVLCWIAYTCNKPMRKTWQTRRGSHFPPFGLPTGGTHITAIAQLVNWVRGRSVLPIQTWQYWCSESVGMKHGDSILPLLQNSDYPKKKECCFCGSTTSSLDWYSFSVKDQGLGCWKECEAIEALRNKHFKAA